MNRGAVVSAVFIYGINLVLMTLLAIIEVQNTSASTQEVPLRFRHWGWMKWLWLFSQTVPDSKSQRKEWQRRHTLIPSTTRLALFSIAFSLTVFNT